MSTDEAEEALMTDVLHPGGFIPAHGLTEAMHVGETDVPFVDMGDGSSLQLLQVDLNQGLWIVRVRFAAGHVVDTHYHTGCVLAFTISGSWYYSEYPETVNRAGSYLYEPAHSKHTLTVGADNDSVTDVWFAIYGANINLSDSGEIIGVTDAQSVLAAYRGQCEAQGLSHENVIVMGEPG